MPKRIAEAATIIERHQAERRQAIAGKTPAEPAKQPGRRRAVGAVRRAILAGLAASGGAVHNDSGSATRECQARAGYDGAAATFGLHLRRLEADGLIERDVKATSCYEIRITPAGLAELETTEPEPEPDSDQEAEEEPRRITDAPTTRPQSLPERAPAGLRTFAVERQHDQSGVSGVGIVLEGVVFSTGLTVVHWLTPPPAGSLNVFLTFDQFMGIHIASHPANEARIHWDDGTTWEPNNWHPNPSPWKVA